MASVAPREQKIGTIIDRTLTVLDENTVAALIFLVVLTAVDGAITYFSIGITAPLTALSIGLGTIVVNVIASYFLLDTMLRKTGLSSRTEDVFLAYFGLAILYTLAVLLGLILIVIPGLFLIARWSIAQPVLLAKGTGVMEAFGESWARTRGNEFQILVAALALVAVFVLILILASSYFEQESVLGIAVKQLAQTAMSVVMMSMGVALYSLIGGAPVESPTGGA